MLLAGYLYARLSLKWPGPRQQAAWHLVLLGLPWTALPIGVAQGWVPPQAFSEAAETQGTHRNRQCL
jgi:hypothetical protein